MNTEQNKITPENNNEWPNITIGVTDLNAQNENNAEVTSQETKQDNTSPLSSEVDQSLVSELQEEVKKIQTSSVSQEEVAVTPFQTIEDNVTTQTSASNLQNEQTQSETVEQTPSPIQSEIPLPEILVAPQIISTSTFSNQSDVQPQIESTITEPLKSDGNKKTILIVVSLFIVVVILGLLYFVVLKKDDSVITQVTPTPSQEIIQPIIATSTVTTTTEEISKFDIVNNIKVPVLATSAELLKVDTNSNGVRDDVERLIANKSSSQDSFNKAVLTAAVLQQVLDKKVFSKKESLTMIGMITCLENNRSQTEKKELSYTYLSKISADTPELQDILFSLLVTAGNYQTKDLSPCSTTTVIISQ